MLNWQKSHLTSSHQQHNEYYRENWRKDTPDPRFKGGLCSPGVISVLSAQSPPRPCLSIPQGRRDRSLWMHGQTERPLSVFIRFKSILQYLYLVTKLLPCLVHIFDLTFTICSHPLTRHQRMSINNIVWNPHFRACKMSQRVKALPSSFF